MGSTTSDMPDDRRERPMMDGLVRFPESCGPDLERRLYAALSRTGWRAPPEIAVFGEWDTANLGDRAIHREVLRFFSECGWSTSAYGLGSLAPAGENIPPEVSARAAPAARAMLHSLAPAAARTLREVRQQCRMLRLLPRLSRVQAIAVGGGALLSDALLHFPQSLAVLAESARLLNKPMLCLGCSSEGSWSAEGERRIAQFLAACAGIAVRDEATAERVATLLCRPVPVFGDFCLTEAHVRYGMHWATPRYDVAINVARIPDPWGAAQAQYEDALVAIFGHLARGFAGQNAPTIRIFTTGLPSDEPPAKRVFTRLSGNRVELNFPRSLEELSAILRTSVLVIASRLHGAVLGLAEGAPVVGFSPAPKLANYFSTMGIGPYSFGLGDVARLTRWLRDFRHESVLAGQRQGLERAPVWFARTQVRTALEAVAGFRTMQTGARCT